MNVQLILLTATLPVEMEDILRTILGCESMTVVRRRGERPEFKYRVVSLPETARQRRDLDREVFRLVLFKLEALEEDDRIIVYCLQHDWAEELSEYLNVKLGVMRVHPKNLTFK